MSLLFHSYPPFLILQLDTVAFVWFIPLTLTSLNLSVYRPGRSCYVVSVLNLTLFLLHLFFFFLVGITHCATQPPATCRHLSVIFIIMSYTFIGQQHLKQC